MDDLTTALPTFVVTLREGFEAALVVGIVLACLAKANKTYLNRWVYLGIGGGIVASVMVGLFLRNILQSLEYAQGSFAPVVKQTLEGIFALVAIAMLSWMLIWMSLQAKSMKSEVEGAIDQALAQKGSGKAIFILIFIAVLREGFETVLFIVAQFQQGWTIPTLGAVAGLSLASLMGLLLFKWGIKINIRLFFQVMGIILLLIVGGLVIGSLKHFDAAITLLSNSSLAYSNLCVYSGPSCILGPLIWDTSAILPDKTFPGILLKSLFGYRDTLYLVQAVAYVLFLLSVGTAYLQSLNSQKPAIKKSEALETEKVQG